MLRSPVGAIAPGGSSCVSILPKRIIGTAIERKIKIPCQENGSESVDGLTVVLVVLNLFSKGVPFL